MTQSGPTGDIVLERSSTRFVDTLDVTTSNEPGQPKLRLDPETSTVTVQGDDEADDPTVRIETGGSTTLATLTYSQRADVRNGRLRLADRTSSRVVDVTTASGSGRIELREDDRVQARLAGVATRIQGGAPRAGGYASVHYSDGTEAVVAKAVPARISEASTGLLEVKNSDGTANGRLVGRDATLELTADTPAGGEVMVVGERLDGPDDIYVHATGDEQSEWGTDAGNRPRISIDGRSARVTLGRGPMEGQSNGIDGRLSLRYGGGEYVSMVPREGDGYATGAIGYRDGLSSSQQRNAMTGVLSREFRESGLLFSPSSPTLLVGTNLNVPGYGLAQGGIPNVGPEFPSDMVEEAFGEVAEIELTVGDGSRSELVIDERDYRFRAEVSPGTDGRVWLLFDTRAVGDQSRPTFTMRGDASISIAGETQLEETPDDYRFTLAIRDEYGNDTVTLEVEP